MNTPTRQPMAFMHAEGMVPAWQQAMQYASLNGGGHLATLPELVEARLQTADSYAPIWSKYYATSSAEYYGVGRSGKRLLIVAHGVGPMATLEGAKKAYSWEYKDKSRGRRGGRITQEEFWKLEDGTYGEVSIIDFDSYYLIPSIQRKYVFNHQRAAESLADPLLSARLGKKADAYIERLIHESQQWQRSEEDMVCEGQDFFDPCVIELGGANNAPYPSHHEAIQWYEKGSPGMAMGHLLVMEQPRVLHYYNGRHLLVAVKCQEWSNNWCFLSIPDGTVNFSDVLDGPDARRLLEAHWEKLFQPVEEPQFETGMRIIMSFGDEWFTQYPKVGARMDTDLPEFRVLNKVRVGQPVQFRTSAGGGFFYKYHLKEIVDIAPQGANAYRFTTKVKTEGDNVLVRMVQFYTINVDPMRRLMKAEALGRDLGKMFSLLNADEL